jgi:hypothetical protein
MSAGIWIRPERFHPKVIISATLIWDISVISSFNNLISILFLAFMPPGSDESDLNLIAEYPTLQLVTDANINTDLPIRIRFVLLFVLLVITERI